MVSTHTPEDSRLTFVEHTHATDKEAYGDYRCICGNIKNVCIRSARNGSVRSCGCLLKETSAANGRRSSHRQTKNYLTYKGIRKSLVEWSRLLGIQVTTLGYRAKSPKWTAERALETPTHTYEPDLEFLENLKS